LLTRLSEATVIIVTALIVIAIQVAVLVQQGEAMLALRTGVASRTTVGWFGSDAIVFTAFWGAMVLGYLAIVVRVRPQFRRAVFIAAAYFLITFVVSYAISLSMVETLYPF
jgi:hypothetical protein